MIARGKGSRVIDVDGKGYIDYVGSWGPLILGHAHPKIVRQVKQKAAQGFTFGAPTEAEVQLAELVNRMVPSIEMLRLVSSGTEAAMSAVRLARAFTARRKILKFDGCYHGHSDGMLVRAGSGVATLGLPDSPGVPAGYARETLTARYNDLQSVQKLFTAHAYDIAAIIIEPVCGNMGVIPPLPGFLKSLRRLTRENGSLLIFDEVITGFRLGPGGGQEIFNVKPDLTCLGKILGGGFPLAAFGGSARIMKLVAPCGPVYQAGTLSGNPMAVCAGAATLELLGHRGLYKNLDGKADYLASGFRDVIKKRGIQAVINRVGSMMTLFFGVDQVRDADDARRSDRRKFASYFQGMLRRGIYLPPAPFEAMFVSTAHSTRDLDATIRAFNQWAVDSRT